VPAQPTRVMREAAAAALIQRRVFMVSTFR